MGDHHADAGDVDVEQLPYILAAVQPVIDLDALAIGGVKRETKGKGAEGKRCR